MMTVGEALIQARGALGRSPSPDLDAEVLLAHVLETERTWLLAHPERLLSGPVHRRFWSLVEQRMERYPVAYLEGGKEFYGRRFVVNSNVMVPRPHSETLIEVALGRLRQGDTLVDVGTGSGCIGLTLLAERPGIGLHLVDVSGQALAVAKENARRLRVDPVQFHRADLWPDKFRPDPKRTVVVANLPYLSEPEFRSRQWLRHEPEISLLGGQDGLAVVRRFIERLRSVPFEPRHLLLEHSFDHGPTVRKLLGPRAETFQDLVGRDRITGY